MADYEEKDDLVNRLLELGRNKKNFLSYDDLNREMPDGMVSPEDIEDVLQKLEGTGVSVSIPIRHCSKGCQFGNGRRR